MQRSNTAAGAKARLWNMAYGPGRLRYSRSLRRKMQRHYDRAERSERKLKSSGRIPFLGVYLDRRTIKAHLYLAALRLPHSESVVAAATSVAPPVSRPILPLMALLALAVPNA